jgi:hypothetical protein
VLLGSNQQFTVTGVYSDGSQKDLTQSASWSVEQATIATISSPGVAVAKQPGTATITAATGSVSGSATLTVSSPDLISLAVSPARPSVPKGNTQQFRAIGTFSDKSTQDVTGSVVWTTSGNIASINGSGLAVGKTVGQATITATADSISATDTLTVTAPAMVLLSVDPVDSSVALNTNVQLHASGTFSDGSTQDVSGAVSWDSSSPAVTTINANGLATTWGIGKAAISATSGSLTVTGTITVLPIAAVDYFTNANNPNAPDATINLVNTGLTGGDLCAMIYVFDSSQELNECCGCSISQDGIKILSVNTDLTSNPLTREVPTTGVIRIIPADAASNPTCNAGSVTPSGIIIPWATHIQSAGAGTFAVTENQSQLPTLSSSELNALASDCAFLKRLGSGHGVCTCGTGD